MAYARAYVCENILPGLGLNYFAVDSEVGKASQAVENEIDTYMKTKYPKLAEYVDKVNVRMPWVRMFEADVKLDISQKQI